MRANDAIVGAVLITLSLAMIAFTATFPDFPGQKFGPALFPRILGAGLVVCGVLMIRNGLAKRQIGETWVAFAPWARERGRVLALALVIALLLFYILAADTIGFIPVAIVFLALLLLRLGVRIAPALAIALITTVTMQYFFGSAMRVPLPRGWLTNLM